MPSQNGAPSSSTATTPASTSTSPILQLLSSLGMTREDLEKHTSRMRQFLDSEHAQKIVRAQANGELRGDSSAEMLAYLTGVASAHNTSKRPAMPPPARTSHHETSSPSPSTVSVLRHSRSTSHVPKPLSIYPNEHERSSERSSTRHSRTHTRNRRRAHIATSPSTSTRPKLSLDEVMQMRSSRRRRVSVSEESEESGDESLRDVFVKSTAGVSTPHYKYPHPARPAQPSFDNKHHHRQHSPALSHGGNYYRNELYLNVNPHTPTRNSGPKSLSHYRHTYATRNRLPPSSPPASPISSPSKYPFNFVSSPGPMSDPADQFSEELPYALPPRPYSNEKPDFSYAALIGQAISASPDHALRLKDIYDYISTVYPYFKRDGHSHSQKWMNAIRQNLTNTPQFFKKEHPSGKASKGALWCIADKDLPCFAQGGYNRHALNPDSVQSQKAEKRKRKKEEKLKDERAKKARLAQVVHSGYTYSYGVAHFPFAPMPVPAQMHPGLIFPPLPPDHPSAHLVNTASTSKNETPDDGIIFPPLPAYSQTRIAREQRLKELAGDTASSPPTSSSCRSPEPASDDDVPSSPVLAPPLSSEASTSSVPDLTPNNSSSSPRAGEDDADEDEFAYFSEYLESETQSLYGDSAYAEDDEGTTNKGKGKEKETEDEALWYTSEPSLCNSSTLLAAQATRSPSTNLYASTAFLGYSVNRSSTPPNDLSVYLSGSHTLTPLGRRNLPSTPTRKRKTSNSVADNLFGSEERPVPGPLPKTPTRHTEDATSGAGPSNVPVTPRRIFSPFIGFSPFRTPSRRSIFDAADPSRILDDELEALALAKQHAQDSPVGLFPRGKGLLYESPSMPSPGKWRPW